MHILVTHKFRLYKFKTHAMKVKDHKIQEFSSILAVSKFGQGGNSPYGTNSVGGGGEG